MNNFSAALAIVAQAKIRADEEEAKGMNALPDLDGDGIPGVPLPGAPMTPTFSTGQAVRDILSGTEGVVVDAPEGITDLIFVRSDIDGLTYAIRPDQLEVLPNAAPPMPMPMPGGPDAGSDAGAEEVVEEVKDEEVVAASLKAGKSYEEYKNSPEMKAIRKKRLAEEAEDKAAGRGPGVEPVDPTDTIITEEGVRHGAKAKLKSTSIVSDPGDLRKITYAKLKTVAGKTITSSKLVAAFGYVPQSWDGIVNALQADGVTVLRAGVKPDVRAMLAKKMNAREILLEACVSGGAIRASTIRRIEAVKNALAISAKLKANKRPKASLFRSRRVKAEIATKPTKPQPSADPGENMSWAWDNTKQEWYLQSIASKKIKAGELNEQTKQVFDWLMSTPEGTKKLQESLPAKKHDGETGEDTILEFYNYISDNFPFPDDKFEDSVEIPALVYYAQEQGITASKKIKAGIKRLQSGRWLDTNGNSYATAEEAAEQEAANMYMDPDMSEDDPEYQTQLEMYKEEILSNIGSKD